MLILLEPPTMEELERRLRSRGTETEEGLARRLAKAGELEQREAFDEVIVNEKRRASPDEVRHASSMRRPQDRWPARGPPGRQHQGKERIVEPMIEPKIDDLLARSTRSTRP